MLEWSASRLTFIDCTMVFQSLAIHAAHISKFKFYSVMTNPPWRFPREAIPQLLAPLTSLRHWVSTEFVTRSSGDIMPDWYSTKNS